MICKDFVIIDDICDGGATFIGIAEAIHNFRKDYKCIFGKIDLIVTHGVFSKGFTELTKCIDNIYCTNSVKTIGVPGYAHREEKGSGIVHQLDIFK
jgi:ribose-phosphate pyrophosphokinase